MEELNTLTVVLVGAVLAAAVWTVVSLALYLRREFRRYGLKGGIVSVLIDILFWGGLCGLAWFLIDVCIRLYDGRMQTRTASLGVLSCVGLYMVYRFVRWTRSMVRENGGLEGSLMVARKFFKTAFLILMAMTFVESIDEGGLARAFFFICDYPAQVFCCTVFGVVWANSMMTYHENDDDDGMMRRAGEEDRYYSYRRQEQEYLHQTYGTPL